MKITFVCPEVNQSGGSRVTAIYALKLLERGHDVTVVGRNVKATSTRRQILERLRGTWKPLPDRDLYFRPLGERFRWLPFKFPLDPEDVPDADVIIATWWRTAFEVAAMPRQKGKKIYFVQHHEVHDHLPHDLSAGSYWLPLKKITIASWLVDTMANLYGDTDVGLVPNAVDVDQFNAPPRSRNTRPRVGLMYSPITFKGLDVMLEAIRIARHAVPDLQVTAFGKRDPEPNFPLPAGAEYHASPDQNDIPGLYASCDVWLFGSRSEGFGLPLLEAMACRTPVVATRSGAAPDLIEPGVNGYLADIDDAEALGARLIDALSLSPEAWRSMSDAAYARAHDYTWDTAADAFEAELTKIAGLP
ncbi:MAG: glycosyltransferase family 4 protein [Pseudomonadota bacterium]